jgi:exonuclease III
MSQPVRMLCWNVNGIRAAWKKGFPDWFDKEQPDILCLQEFQTSTNPEYYDNISYIQKELDYPYFVFSFDQECIRLYALKEREWSMLDFFLLVA